ncbi:hypothetical protein HPP92_016064 [Vanilla planifolia]|uniref:Uncharacterized protein n=1 Tax=Vanilla planifolia TaxID=51239 RepID=A0A835QUR7_VANPL|nr:hypothetical protein HPP92_016064 [Vanilla planifolia]
MVEYLEPSMSEHLLCKFPDDSAFGFDYFQSAIWSPLLPRGLCGPCSSYQDKRPREPRNRKRKAKQGSFKKRLEFSPNPTPKRSSKQAWNGLFKAAATRFKSRRFHSLKKLLPILWDSSLKGLSRNV